MVCFMASFRHEFRGLSLPPPLGGEGLSGFCPPPEEELRTAFLEIAPRTAIVDTDVEMARRDRRTHPWR